MYGARVSESIRERSSAFKVVAIEKGAFWPTNIYIYIYNQVSVKHNTTDDRGHAWNSE